MDIISNFKAQFYKEYNNSILNSSKTSGKVSFFVFEEKKEIMSILLLYSGHYANVVFEDLGDVILLKVIMTINGYSFQSCEKDVCFLCNNVNRTIKFGKVTLNENSLLDINIQYFATKPDWFNSIISFLKGFMDFAYETIVFCEQNGEPTLV